MPRLSPYVWTLTALAAALVLSVALGAVPIPAGQVIRIMLARLPFLSVARDWPATSETILLSLRLPRAALISLAGMALGGSGAAYQGLFRNPLADPYIIGIAAGAALGAVIALALPGAGTMLGLATVPLAAFLGALVTVLVVYNLARVGKTTPVTTLILAGVAVSSFATALSTFLTLRSAAELRRAISWILGGFSMSGWTPVIVMVPYIGIGLGILVALARPLNVLQFGDDQARQLGLHVERLKLVLIGAASLAAATAVAFSGIIGFVGLAVPHVVRLLWGPDYRRLVPLSIIGGAAALLLADLVARTIVAPAELPVGVITALVGAPFFLWLLRRAKQETYW